MGNYYICKMPALSSLSKNMHYAKFATTSRLIACLVSEALVKAVFVPCDVPGIKGLCLLLRPQMSNISGLQDLLAVVPLSGVPITDGSPFLIQGIKCANIILVDGWDMLPHIYSPVVTPIQASDNNTTFAPVVDAEATTNSVAEKLSSLFLTPIGVHQLMDGFDAVQLWTRFATDYGVNGKLIDQISQELDSSMVYQGKIVVH
ncbi:unnamed protein product [Absidia cylindrospora]